MTFSVIQTEGEKAIKIIGMLWARDEAGAREVAPALVGAACDSYRLQRTEEREIPLKFHEVEFPR